MSNLFKRKPLAKLLGDSDEHGASLKKTLGPFNLIALGIGAIIGAGLFVRTAAAAANVGIAWSEYLNKLLEFLPGHHVVPYQWCHSPFEVSTTGVHGLMNLPAL